jgi:hypothetical protein
MALKCPHRINIVMSKIVKDLVAARDQVYVLSTQLNDKVEHILMLLIKLANPKSLEEDDIWWWYGSDDDRPFRRGDRHGYFYGDGQSDIVIYLDEPHISIPGFDTYHYDGPRRWSAWSSEKTIPIKYLDMTDEEIIADAKAVMDKIKQEEDAKVQAVLDAKQAALSKLTEEDKRVLGIKA